MPETIPRETSHRDVRRVEQLRMRNQNLLDLLLRQSRAKYVRMSAKTLYDPSAAEDAVQEACLRAIQTNAQFDVRRGCEAKIDPAFASWFETILHNVVADWNRASCRRPAPDAFSQLPDGVEEAICEKFFAVNEPGVFEQVAAGMRTFLEEVTMPDGTPLLQGWNALDDHDRWALTKVYLEDLEEVEVAGETGFSPGAIRSRLMTARDKFREAITLARMARAGQEAKSPCGQGQEGGTH